MKFFQYQAEDKKGYPCSGTLKAADEEDARQKLAARGLRVLAVEYDRDATSRLSRRSLNRPDRPETHVKTTWNNFLSYAMPLGAAVIALAGIPLMLHFLKPQIPEISPGKVLEQYLEAEKNSRYAGQYSLLSAAVKRSYETPEDYAQARRKEKSRYGLGKVHPAGMELLEETPREAHFEVRYLRPSGMSKTRFILKPRGGHWRIDAVRDEEVVKARLEEITQSPEAETRKSVVALKRITGYSDQEIETLLKKHRIRKRLTAPA